MKLYREVKASERLPTIDGWAYFTDLGELNYDSDRNIWYDIIRSYKILWWIESIEITEEEIKRVITEEMEEGAFGANVIDHFVPKLTKAILSKLKGE